MAFSEVLILTDVESCEHILADLYQHLDTDDFTKIYIDCRDHVCSQAEFEEFIQDIELLFDDAPEYWILCKVVGDEGLLVIINQQNLHRSRQTTEGILQTTHFLMAIQENLVRNMVPARSTKGAQIHLIC